MHEDEPVWPKQAHGAATVILAGAGPGRLQWMTLALQQRLKQADIIAYDHLIQPQILAQAGAQARLVSIGYRGFRKPGQTQPESIPDELIFAARRGQKVLRLKSGDPMIFGRAQEEIRRLRQAQLDVEIIPGITAALGAAAALQLPLTARRVASAVTLSTGHQAVSPSSNQPPIGCEPAHSLPTTVLYMTRHHLAKKIAELMQQGYTAQTPCIFISAASTRQQHTIISQLGELEHSLSGQDRQRAGLLLVGDTTARDWIASLEAKRPSPPLRLVHLAAPFEPTPAWKAAAKLTMPYEYIRQPDFISHQHPSLQEAALAEFRKSKPKQLLFIDPSAVELFFSAYKQSQSDIRDLADVDLLATSAQTLQALKKLGYHRSVCLRGESFVPESTQVIFTKTDFLRPHGTIDLAGDYNWSGCSAITAVGTIKERYFEITAPCPDAIILESEASLPYYLKAKGCVRWVEQAPLFCRENLRYHQIFGSNLEDAIFFRTDEELNQQLAAIYQSMPASKPQQQAHIGGYP